MFRNQRCHPSFCSDCVAKQVATKIQDSIAVVSCPGLDCKSDIGLDACRPWLPKDLLHRWDQALCQAVFLAAPIYYCPFQDCSAMLLIENEEEDHQQDIGEAECPKLEENEIVREDLVVREPAKEKKWRRFPQCSCVGSLRRGLMDACTSLACASMSFARGVENNGLLLVSVCCQVKLGMEEED
ncbi:uncharacterized protein LOC129289272 [Prosopis cineraria]|uniref:uncharacterized protein LOC129289272 n=1 Tax=Prosopis cineraria TaxID=364024 RepID=UPI00240EC6FD|nr:uncharacterized protein LOC129289272 [Prosopis cineraria]